MDFFYYLVICKCISTTVRVNDTAWFGTFEWHFLLCHEIEYYHCHKLWFAHCNPCNVIFSSLKLGNGLKKYVWNVARIKYGFVKLVVILFLLVTLNHKTWCFLIALCSLIVRRPNLEVATKRLLHQQVKIMGTVLMPCCAWNCVPETILDLSIFGRSLVLILYDKWVFSEGTKITSRVCISWTHDLTFWFYPFFDSMK